MITWIICPVSSASFRVVDDEPERLEIGCVVLSDADGGDLGVSVGLLFWDHGIFRLENSGGVIAWRAEVVDDGGSCREKSIEGMGEEGVRKPLSMRHEHKVQQGGIQPLPTPPKCLICKQRTSTHELGNSHRERDIPVKGSSEKQPPDRATPIPPPSLVAEPEQPQPRAGNLGSLLASLPHTRPLGIPEVKMVPPIQHRHRLLVHRPARPQNGRREPRRGVAAAAAVLAAG